MDKKTRLYSLCGVHIASYYFTLHSDTSGNVKYLKHD